MSITIKLECYHCTTTEEVTNTVSIYSTIDSLIKGKWRVASDRLLCEVCKSKYDAVIAVLDKEHKKTIDDVHAILSETK